jgi:hypothetical protein
MNDDTPPIKPWGKVDKKYLQKLIDDGKVDNRRTNESRYIDRIRVKFFRERDEKNFRRIFDRVCADRALPGGATRSWGMPRRGPTTTTTTTTTTRGGTRRRRTDDDDDDDDDADGGDSSNRTVVGRCYGRPRDRHPARGPGVVHVEASAGIRAGVRVRTMTGREVEGGGGGEYDGEFLFDDDSDDDEYDDVDEYDNAGDGKGSRG